MCAIFVFIDMIFCHALRCLFMSHVNRAGLVSLHNGAVGSAQPLFQVPCLKLGFCKTWLKNVIEF